MVEQQQDVLRLQPHMIPELRASFATAIDQVKGALLELSRNGYISAPWMGDETSSEVAAHYTAKAMDGPESSFHALVAYRNELTHVHETLQQMEDEYRRREGDDAAQWGRLV